MKKTISAIAVIAAIGSTAFSPAHAGDGVINFIGKLETQTCTIDVNGVANPAVYTVVLPTVSIDRLATAGATTGQSGFVIGLKNCSSIIGSTAAFFEHGPSVDTSGNLNNDGTAANVKLQLVDGTSGAVLTVGRPLQNTTKIPLDANGSARMPYAVQYYATGAATAGTVSSSVTYSIAYY